MIQQVKSNLIKSPIYINLQKYAYIVKTGHYTVFFIVDLLFLFKDLKILG